MRFISAILLVLLTAVPLFAQLTVPDVVAPYEPIICGCNCIIPENGQASFLWTVDSKSKYRGVPEEAPTKIHVWAPPGQHSVEAIVIVKLFETYTIVVNKETGETREIRVPVNFDIQRYSKNYTVGNAPNPPPDNPDNPDPPPGPGPTDPFAKEVQKWLKALPAGHYIKARALGIADNYQAVASEAVAVQGTYDILAFSQKTKDKNWATLGNDGVLAWKDAFFQPLATYQSNLATQRGIDIYKDEAGLAKIWTETANAIKAAAF